MAGETKSDTSPTQLIDLSNARVEGPYVGWGGVFREPSLDLVSSRDNGIEAVSFIAVRDDDTAHTYWGRLPDRSELTGIFDRQSRQLVESGTPEPEWRELLEEPYETLKKRAGEDEMGLLAVAHQNGSTPDGEMETAVFGMSRPAAVVALAAISRKFL